MLGIQVPCKYNICIDINLKEIEYITLNLRTHPYVIEWIDAYMKMITKYNINQLISKWIY
jgi:hypothetical protein